MKVNLNINQNQTFKMQYRDKESEKMMKEMKKEWKNDSFLMDTVEFAEKWADNMEKSMKKGKTKMSSIAYPAAVEASKNEKVKDFDLAKQILARLWKYGESFKEWSEKSVLEVE